MHLTNFITKNYSFVQYSNSNKKHIELFENITNDKLSKTFYEHWKHMFIINNNDSINALIVEKDGIPIGITTLVRQNNDDYLLSYIISPNYRGNNYCSGLVLELVDFLFNYDDVNNVISYIDKNNKNSISSMLKTKPDKIICDYNNENMLKVVYKNKKLKGEINNGKSR